MIKLKTKTIHFCLYSIIFSCIILPLKAQLTWQPLADMPKSVGNNAVTSATVDDVIYVYSFGGVDSTKTLEGITQKSMRYNTLTDVWSFIPDLPDTLGKIASAASTVNNIIYITGGYHVFSGSPFELSSDKIHRYDPEINEFLTDGAPMPYAIDDHVQAVWRDSLIFMITGWSDNGNVPYVQIYNPSMDTWTLGTSTPDNNAYNAFGASGVIIGDTIFYNGGAAGSSFNSTSKMRRGIIDENDPTNIVWDLLDDNPGDKGYRMAAVAVDEHAVWIGGSGITYNYDGIAYNGTGGVPPLHRILTYNSGNGLWTELLGQPYGVMDLRGAAQITNNSFIICGGMLAEQEVSNKAFLITLDFSTDIEELEEDHLVIYPNPIHKGDILKIRGDQLSNNFAVSHVTMTNSLSQIVKIEQRVNFSDVNIQIDTNNLESGNYFVQIILENGSVLTYKLIII